MMRVHELAKEYDIKATEFVDIIQEFGIDIRSHLSGLDEDQVSDIRHKMSIKDQPVEDEAPKDLLGVIDKEEVAGFTAKDREEVQAKLAEVKERQFASIDRPKGFFGWIASLFS
tara:strand:+ start:484 stop:825 length:342 start_codon:yes stop_codon:yes gene_type:complete